MKRLLVFFLFAASALAQSSTGGDKTVVSATSGATSGGISSRFWAPGPLYPYLPVATPNVTLPNTSGYTTLTTSSLATLNADIATAAAGCDNGGGSGATGYVINIPQGAAYNVGGATGIVLPATTCTVSKIIIQTAGLSWTRGTRIDPSTQAGTLAKLTSTAANGEVLSCAAHTACGPYWFLGVEIECANTTFSCNGFSVGATSVVAEFNHDLTFDHDYIHGHISNITSKGLDLGGVNISVVDSWLSEWHDTSNDSQALHVYAGGPWLFQNNFVEGATENILTNGANLGSVMTVVGANTHDLTDNLNWFYKPQQWRIGSTSPVFYGGPVWDVKNMHEFKGCVRCLVENFIMQWNWISSQNGNNLLTNTATSQNGVYTLTQDLTFQYGKTIGGVTAFETTGEDLSVAADVARTRRVMFYNIIADNLNIANCALVQGGACTSGTYSQVSAGPWGWIQDHITAPAANTNINDTTLATRNGILGMIYFTNSIVPAGGFGFFTTSGSANDHGSYQGTAGGGTSGIWAGGQAPVFLNDAVVGMGAVVNPSGACTTWYTGTTCPAAMTNIGFVNWNSGNGGDYRLCTGVNTPAAPCAGASAYISGGANGCTVNPDGTGGPANCGADVATINTLTAGVATVPSLWPDSLSGGGISLSPTSLTCNGSNTVTISPVAGSSGGSTFVQSGLDVMVNGTVVSPTSSSTSSIVITPVTYSGAVSSITQTSLTGPNDAIYTATNTLAVGDLVTVTGTTNSAGLFNVTNGTVNKVSGSAFHVWINHFSSVGAQAETGSATSTLPVTVSNFGLPLTASLTCN